MEGFKSSALTEHPSTTNIIQNVSSRHLPAEIVGLIIDQFVNAYGLDHAVHLRYVCRTFDSEVVRATCHLHCLERHWTSGRLYHHPRLTHKYLVSQLAPGRVDKHCITRAINASVNWIIQEMPELEDRRQEFLQALCWGAVQLSDTDNISQILSKNHVSGSMYWTKPCKPDSLENRLAASAYLGIVPLVEQLLVKKPDGYFTENGYAVNSAMAGGQHYLACSLLRRGYSWSERRYPSFLPDGHCAVLETLIELYPEGIEVFRRAMLRATAVCNYEAVVGLIARARNASNQPQDEEEQPGFLCNTVSFYNAMLCVAAYHGSEKLVRYAVEHGAALDCKPGWQLWGIRGILPKRNPFTPLEVAAKRGHWSIVRLLLNKGAPATSKALGEAAKAGWIRVAQTLIDEGVKVYPCACGLNGRQEAFIEVVRRGHVDMVRLFLENGLPMAGKWSGSMAKSAYGIAQQESQYSIKDLMLRFGFQPNGWQQLKEQHQAS